MTHPTIGFGSTKPSPRAASSSARAICNASNSDGGMGRNEARVRTALSTVSLYHAGHGWSYREKLVHIRRPQAGFFGAGGLFAAGGPDFAWLGGRCAGDDDAGAGCLCG